MSQKPKTATLTKRQKQRQEARQFLWHLRPPWRDKFDHEHWWKKTGATPAAALWEVLRRHPQTEQLLTKKKPLYQNSPRFEFYLADDGAKSWPKLTGQHRLLERAWSESLSDLPPQWGFGAPDLSDFEVIQENKIADFGQRFWDTFNFEAFKDAQRIWEDSAAPPGSFGGGANFKAFLQLSLGHILIGFDPHKPGIEKRIDMEVRKIIKEAREKVRRERKGDTVRKLYFKKWLHAIYRFEHHEFSRKSCVNRNSDWAALYRRIYEGRPWPI